MSEKHIQRTPSDVPRTAELIEMSSGPGKTVTEYDKSRGLRKSWFLFYFADAEKLNKNANSGQQSSQTYKTGTLHFISGITPIKDTTYASTGEWCLTETFFLVETD